MKYHDATTHTTYAIQDGSLYHDTPSGRWIFCSSLAYAGHYARNLIMARQAAPDLENWIDAVRRVYAVGLS